MTEDIRRFTRYGTNRDATAIWKGRELPILIVEDSIGGQLWQFQQTIHVQRSDELSIELDGEPVKAYVCYSYRDSDGRLNVGVSWKQVDPSDDLTTEISADFFRFGELEVVCRERNDRTDGTSEVTLWDGKTFRASTDNLHVIGRDVRSKDLYVCQSNVPTLVDLYQLRGAGDLKSLVNDILDFEFGQCREIAS